MSDTMPDQPDPANPQTEQCRAELGPYQLFMFGLGVYVLLALAAETFLPLSKSTNAILDHLDDGICLIFFVDFFVWDRGGAHYWESKRRDVGAREGVFYKG